MSVRVTDDFWDAYFMAWEEDVLPDSKVLLTCFDLRQVSAQSYLNGCLFQRNLPGTHKDVYVYCDSSIFEVLSRMTLDLKYSGDLELHASGSVDDMIYLRLMM